MTTFQMNRLGAFVLFSCLAVADTTGQDLTSFTSSEGKFSVSLPAEPTHEETDVGPAGAANTVQHQFTVGTENGIYLVSYQDNPNLQGATKAKIEGALKLGIEALKQAFGGEITAQKDIQLVKVHAGKEVRVSIPAAKGEARCRMYLVGTRLYQVMAVGLPAFVASDQSDKVLDSFTVVIE